MSLPKIDFNKMKQDLPFVKGESGNEILTKHINWLKNQMTSKEWDDNEIMIKTLLVAMLVKAS